MTINERMDYAARRKKEMNCCQEVLVAFASELGRSEEEFRDLKGAETGKVLCGCEHCVRNAIQATAEIFSTRQILLNKERFTEQEEIQR